MKEHGLLAPHRPANRPTNSRDGTIVTERVDQIWGTDMTQSVTTAEGRAYVLITVDHCSGEFVGTHASLSACRRDALEPIRQGVTQHFGKVEAGTALGLVLRPGPMRHDHGPNYMSNDFQREIRFLGADAFAGLRPSAQGQRRRRACHPDAEEQLLWVHSFATVEDLRLALAEFATLYTANWPRARHGHKTPNQIRAEQFGLETEAATGFKLAAWPVQCAVSNPCRSRMQDIAHLRQVHTREGSIPAVGAGGRARSPGVA